MAARRAPLAAWHCAVQHRPAAANLQPGVLLHCGAEHNVRRRQPLQLLHVQQAELGQHSGERRDHFALLRQHRRHLLALPCAAAAQPAAQQPTPKPAAATAEPAAAAACDHDGRLHARFDRRAVQRHAAVDYERNQRQRLWPEVYGTGWLRHLWLRQQLHVQPILFCGQRSANASKKQLHFVHR